MDCPISLHFYCDDDDGGHSYDDDAEGDHDDDDGDGVYLDVDGNDHDCDPTNNLICPSSSLRMITYEKL